MSFRSKLDLQVYLDFGEELIPVATLAIKNSRTYFEYLPEFLDKGLEISPFKLPLEPGLKSFDNLVFNGLPGVFYDSLPDGWGRLLLDRQLRAQGILPEQINSLDRLAYVGSNAMGALVYQPEHSASKLEANFTLDDLSESSQEILKGNSQEVLEELLILNGSSAGARPKVMIGLNEKTHEIFYGAANNMPEGFEPYIVKFPNTQDGIDAGAIEYVYSLMAKEAGLEMTETILLPAKNGPGFFATKRFDRQGSKRFHMHSVAGLLDTNFRLPSLDYEDLLNLTEALCQDMNQVEKMFRLAIFNVLAHNRDDHAKNFSFLMDSLGFWRLSPAYDLTFSNGPGAEQSTTVLGEGKNPCIEDLKALGKKVKLSSQFVASAIEACRASLSQWQALASEHGVSTKEKYIRP